MAGGSMAGAASPMAQMVSQINQAESMSKAGDVGFVSPSELGQQAPYQPNLPQAPQQMSPLVQQLMQRSMAPQPIMGLPAALLQMQGQFNRPMMRGPMPTYQNPALAYRPDIQAVQQNLTRVQPSVYKTDLDAARARIAELEAAQQPAPQPYYDSGGGG